MEIPQENRSKTLHAPLMGKVSKELGAVMIGVLGDYVIEDLRKEIKDLRNRLQHHVDFVEDILIDRRHNGEGRADMATPFPHCHFCHELVKPNNGGACPCGSVGHCSVECQELDWKRNHKKVCSGSMELVD